MRERRVTAWVPGFGHWTTKSFDDPGRLACSTSALAGRPLAPTETSCCDAWPVLMTLTWCWEGGALEDLGTLCGSPTPALCTRMYWPTWPIRFWLSTTYDYLGEVKIEKRFFFFLQLLLQTVKVYPFFFFLIKLEIVI